MGGAIEKLVIDTYIDSSYSNTGKISSNSFKALFNPTSFSLTYKTNLEKNQAIGTPKADLKYISSPPSDLQLEFLFDGTGIAEANLGNKQINKIAEKISKGSAFAKTAVTDQINAFHKATVRLDGTIHKPNNVIISWGELQFKGILVELVIEYKLFNSQGRPLRAIGKAKFSESISPELANNEATKCSPDLTHKRIVKAGDTLPLMTEKIYGDSKYYLEVAKANNLINFRQLIPGQELFFPPIEKTA